MNESSAGGSLTTYFTGPVVRKIVATRYGEMGRTVDAYYFWQGQLFFVLSTEVHYDQPLGADVLHTPPGTVKSRSQNRFYFSNGKLVRWVGPNRKAMDVKSAAAQQQESEILGDARHLIAASRSR